MVWTIISELSALACFLVIAIVLSKPQLRTQTFNKFIVGLVFPDFLFSFICGWQCLAHYMAGHWYGSGVSCALQAWYCTYAFAGSMWMNVIIARQLHRLTVFASNSEPYAAPSACNVHSQIGAVHLLSAVFAAVPLVKPLPADVGRVSGLACLPIEYDFASTVFHWLFTLNLMLVVPFCLILWYFGRAARSCHRTGAALNASDRAIIKFFIGLLVVFLTMWIPAGIFIWFFTSGHMAFWGGTWSHIQGPASAMFYLLKPDIREELKVLPDLPRVWLRRCLPSIFPKDRIARRTSDTANVATQHAMQQLSHQVLFDILSLEQTPMIVIEYDRFMSHGRFPRSSEELTRPWRKEDVVIFISHRWWEADCPDDAQGNKYATLCKGIRYISSLHHLDKLKTVLWCDWACIDQDDMHSMSKGIASLITYAARSDYVIIPVRSDLDSIGAFRSAEHPMALHMYGERAWCRLEIYMFMCIAEMRQRTPYCYGIGPTSFGVRRCVSRERLRPLFKAVDRGASLDLAQMPSTGMLTAEDDRTAIKKIEDDMRDMYVRWAILAQKSRMEVNHRYRMCGLSGKQVRCIDVPLLVEELSKDRGELMSRVTHLILEGNLLGPFGVEIIMKEIVCSPAATALTVLSLSNNPLLDKEALEHIADGLKQSACHLTDLCLSACGFEADEIGALVDSIPFSHLRRLDVSHNNIDDVGCDSLLAASGGLEDPFIALVVRGNPLSRATLAKVARAAAALELGHSGRRPCVQSSGSGSVRMERTGSCASNLSLEDSLPPGESNSVYSEPRISRL